MFPPLRASRRLHCQSHHTEPIPTPVLKQLPILVWIFTLFLAVIMLPLTPITTIGAGSYRGVKLCFRSCLHNTVSPTLIFITAVCLLLSAYCFIFSFCLLWRWRITVSSVCLGWPLTSGNFSRSSLPNMSLFGWLRWLHARLLCILWLPCALHPSPVCLPMQRSVQSSLFSA